ncbi:MAG: tyrosine-type recombinase/integrase [Ignavibacteriae bacterium]|nr:tyrosine-type recombinase/integrase [Ignavibacteriota bacterium]
MPDVNYKNELAKRNFFRWLKEAKGLCDASVNCYEKAILLYEDFSDHSDFSRFSSDKAIEFKKWLLRKKNKGKTISVSTYHTYLRYLKVFFSWLCMQDDYKNKISLDSVSYLNASEKDVRIATHYVPRKYPTLEDVFKVVTNIKIESEIDLRDRAMISFTLLSGMRDKAIITLPIGCFDVENLIINQNPKRGVQTKFSKYISSVLFRFDERLVEYVLEWVKHLKEKNFGLNDPLFPKNKTNKGNDNLSYVKSDSIEPEYWKEAGQIRQIFKKRFKDAHLPYYPPHTFRHLAIDLSFKLCKNGEELKAVSQNFGHDNIATTFRSYANYGPQKLAEILTKMNFSEKQTDLASSKLEQIKEIINNVV